MNDHTITITLKVRVAEGHLQEVKDTMSLASENLQQYLETKGLLVIEGEWKVQ